MLDCPSKDVKMLARLVPETCLVLVTDSLPT